MEGVVGSRLGRASSRYGSSSSSAVFSGPVRKWKRRWVNISYPSTNNNSSSSRSNNHHHNNSSPLVLCRWTPISADNNNNNNSVNTEEPPRRKFRYVPIVVLEDQKQEDSEKVDDKAKTRKASFRSDGIFGIPNTEGVFAAEIQAANKIRLTQQDSNMSNLNLDLGLNGHDEDLESDGEDGKDEKSG